ncbi:MAG TPA: MFS transporter [Anaerolineae bacterium]|nr:MFS transporter [Anaerolineae bacterium]
MASSSSSARRWLYIGVVSLYWISMYLYMPTLPVYAKSKVADLAQVGTILSMYGLWQAVARFPLGIAADWAGRRKPFILGGFALSGLGALLMATADSAGGLLIGRALTGFAASVWVLLVVAYNSEFPPEEAVRASALLSGVNSVARMLATGVTGALNRWGGYPLAFFAAAGTAAAAMLVLAPARETPRPSRAPTLGGLGKLMLRPDVLIPSLLCTVMQYAAWTATFTFTPLLAEQFGATGDTLSLLTSMNIGVVMVGNFGAAPVVKRWGATRPIVWSFVGMLVAMGLLAFAQGLPAIFASQIILGLVTGVSYSVLMGLSIRYVDETQRATAMGLFQAIYAIGMFAGPWLSGILADAIGMQPMFGVVGVACLVLGLLGTPQLKEKTA